MGAGAVAVFVGQAALAVNIEFPAGAGAVFVDGAAHRAADIAQQGSTAARLGFCALHAGPVGADLLGKLIGNHAPGTLTFTPIERHAKEGAAGTATQAGGCHKGLVNLCV